MERFDLVCKYIILGVVYGVIGLGALLACAWMGYFVGLLMLTQEW